MDVVRMRRLLLTGLLTLVTYLLPAQTSVIVGKVFSAADSSALPGATVFVEGGKPNTMCGPGGVFSLAGVKRGTVMLEVSFLGFDVLKMEVKADESRVDVGSLYLVESENAIDAVVVEGEAPIAIQKGDTTQFNAEAFKTNPDADADELLMKMPGVVIQNGKVEAQGEPIRRIYVDGQLFFGTDPMAALKNIPADAVESIQLFDEMSEQSQVTGFDDGDTQKAINIVTKSKNKTTTIFKAEASGGSDIDAPREGRYLAGGNFSHFTPTQHFTVTGLANNVNNMKFGENDMIGGSGLDDNGNVRNQPAGIRDIYGLGVNYSLQNEKVQFSGNYFFDHNSNYTERLSDTRYYASPPRFDSKQILRNSFSDNSVTNHRLNFRLQWDLNPNNTILLSPRIQIQSDELNTDATALTLQDGDSLNRNRTLTPNENFRYTIAGEAMWTHRFEKRGRSLSTNLAYNINSREGDRYQNFDYRDNYRADTLGGGVWNPVRTVDRYFDQLTTSNNLRLRMTWAEPLGARHRLLVNYIMGKEWGESDKQNYRYAAATEDYTNKDAQRSNRFDRDYNSIGGGIGYSFASKHTRLSIGLDYLHLAQVRNEYEPHQVTTHRGFNELEPSLSLRYSLGKSKYLRFRYKGSTVLPNIDYMQSVLDDSSPTYLRVGNPDLKQGYQHDATLFYNAANVERSTNFTLTMNFRTVSNYVTSSTEILPDDTVIVVGGEEYRPQDKGAFLIKHINMDGYVSGRVGATYSFAFRPIRSNINISANYGYIRMPSVYRVENYANTHSGGFRLGITSNISQNVDFNLYSRTTFNFTNNSARENTSYITQNLYYSINVIFWKNFVFNSLFTWRYYTSTGSADFSDSFYLLNVGLGKKLFRKNNGEVRVTAYDLLNQNRNLLHNVRTNAIEDAWTNTLGRYVMVRFLYRFNSMVHGKAAAARKVAGKDYKRISVKQLEKMSGNGTRKK